jgi:hypothetical protein
MTEADWLACEDPQRMLTHLRGKTSERKMRLFICACTRLLWEWLPVGVMQDAVAAGERHADGVLWEEDCCHFVDQLYSLPVEHGRQTTRNWFSEQREETVSAWSGAILASGAWLALSKIPEGPNFRRLSQLTAPQQPNLLRDVFGNPFRPRSIDPAWLTPTVTSLAAAAYEQRSLPSGELSPARLPTLADALEDAGCSDDELLGHLRSPGPHVRGCWALDAVLGKG